MPGRTARILVVEDDVAALTAARQALKRHFAVVQGASTPEAVMEALRDGVDGTPFDVVLLDLAFGRLTKADGGWIGRVRDAEPDAVIVAIAADGDPAAGARAVELGATDFVTKPLQGEKLVATVGAALRLRRARDEAARLRDRERELVAAASGAADEIVGRSSAMREIFELVRRAAPTDDNVLITGERGTGKEALAHLLHRQSRRAAAAFLRIDLGAADAATVESELFGHRKSAFAKELGGRMGRLRAASGGTLFVRDVGRLTAPLQVKLLGALERQAAAPLGADRAALLDVRLVCATQRPLAELVRSGAFRRDLLYRVDSVEIRVPSLRERIEDIAPLIEHFVEVHARELGMPPKRLARGALARLEAYAWPGNVRELRAAVERALLASSAATLAARDLLPEREPPQRRQRAIELDHYDLESVENRVIRAALDKHDGNVSRAARELGITRTSLYRRMERYGLAGRRTARPSR